MPDISVEHSTKYNGGKGQSAFYATANKVPLPLIERASGIHMWDDQGTSYIDVSSGPVVSNIGHGNAIVAEAIHLVFDEILCGMGRTGKFLAAHHWPDALPDIVTMAKGMASGYSPLGAVLAPAVMVDELADLTGFEFQYSYNANPVSSAAGLAVLDEYARLDLTNNAIVMGAKLRKGLESLKAKLPIIGDVRGLGMLLAVEIVADQKNKTSFENELQPTDLVRIHGLNNGLMIYSRPTSGGKYGHWFLVSPPLTITTEEATELLERLEPTLRDLSDQLCQQNPLE